jgi:hypothetical protein
VVVVIIVVVVVVKQRCSLEAVAGCKLRDRKLNVHMSDTD